MKKGIKILFSLTLMLASSVPGMAQRNRHPVSTDLYDEMAPIMLGNKMVFISNRPLSGLRSGTDMDNNNFFKIVESDRSEDGKNWSAQRMFDPVFQTDFHDGPVSFNEKGDFMVFQRCLDEKTTKNDTSKFGLFFADLQNGTWGNIREYPFNVRGFNTINPSLNQEGTIMYFASDRKGFGGYDLYVSRLVNGQWTPPENLGPRINTVNDERFPFVHAKGRLYFSSNGHNARGYDLFYSEYYKGQWIIPIKLPPPYNSGRGDFTFYVDSAFQNGFYTTDRGRRGSKDIYTFSSSFPNMSGNYPKQKINNYCYVFYEENTVELDTSQYLYEWNLGDKTQIRAMEAKHCFAGPAVYIVSLNVIDKLTKDVLFNQAEYELNIEPIVQAYITCPDTIRVNEDVKFSGEESFFKNDTPGEYYWDFGDGTQTSGASVFHTFLVPSTYEVKLKVGQVNTDDKAEDNSAQNEKIACKYCSSKTIVVIEN